MEIALSNSLKATAGGWLVHYSDQGSWLQEIDKAHSNGELQV
jgi:hypothetical protein